MKTSLRRQIFPLLGRNLLLLGALAAIGLVFQALTHDAANSFLSARSVSTIFMQASVIGVLACGMTFIIILTHVDLSVGSALAFLGGIAAWMMAAPAPPPDPRMAELGLAMTNAVPSGLGLPAPLVCILVFLAGVLLWGLKGLLQSHTRMPAFIITLGGMMGYRGLAYLVVRREIPIAYDSLVSRIGTEYLDLRLGWILLTGLLLYGAAGAVRAKRQGLPWLRPAMPALLAGAVVAFLQVEHAGLGIPTRGVAYLTLIWAATAALMGHVAINTVYGRHMYATGGNAEAARLCGIRAARVNTIAFMCMGAIAALASIMYLGQQGTAESSAGQLAELDAIAACVIGGVSLRGGKGSITGAVLGTLIMQSLTSGLYQCNVETGYQMLVKALVLIVVVALDHACRKD